MTILDLQAKTETLRPLASPVDDDARYEAVRRRDRSFDEAFVYAVRTTGVYCRPSCAARLALRENMAFHVTCEAAEKAGFRACKRCRPNEASQSERYGVAVKCACDLIESAEAMPTLADLAAKVGLSTFHFHRIFKQMTGVTPKAYATVCRSNRVTASLRAADTVTRAIFDAGFNASSRFYENATERLGMTPMAYRKGGTGAKIRFAVAECSLGSILVAATAKGICAITLGDDPQTLVQDLQDRFPKAELDGQDASFDQTVAQVVGFVEAPQIGLDLPLHISGTAFQQKVWQALRAIPAGAKASYAEVATSIGKPTAVRAVAQACASNVLAVAIPCHRIVRSDGALSGYRWGVERKRSLLAREAEATAAYIQEERSCR